MAWHGMAWHGMAWHGVRSHQSSSCFVMDGRSHRGPDESKAEECDDDAIPAASR